MKSLPFFHSIRILTRCEVSLCQDSLFGIHVDEPDDIATWMDYFIENEELIIQTKPMHYGFLLLNDSYPKIRVACADLIGIHVLDKAYVSAKEEFQVEKLGVIVQTGEVDLKVNAIVTDCTTIKKGTAKISGNAIISRILGNQRGIYDGSELDASEVHVDLHGDSQASVWAEVELEANLFSRSKLRYKGNPRIQVSLIEEGCSIKAFDPTGIAENRH